jgi:hypothetical protein
LAVIRCQPRRRRHCRLLEEIARHAGHADIPRELIDGQADR